MAAVFMPVVPNPLEVVMKFIIIPVRLQARTVTILNHLLVVPDIIKLKTKSIRPAFMLAQQKRVMMH